MPIYNKMTNKYITYIGQEICVLLDFLFDMHTIIYLIVVGKDGYLPPDCHVGMYRGTSF